MINLDAIMENQALSLLPNWKSDEVAECLDGISEELYKFLWNDIGPSVYMNECWEKLSLEYQNQVLSALIN